MNSKLKLASSQQGGLAQLVERLLCKQNVIGSTPVTSTISFLEGEHEKCDRSRMIKGL